MQALVWPSLSLSVSCVCPLPTCRGVQHGLEMEVSKPSMYIDDEQSLEILNQWIWQVARLWERLTVTLKAQLSATSPVQTDWPIHIGGCDYDYLWKDEGTGYDVVGKARHLHFPAWQLSHLHQRVTKLWQCRALCSCVHAYMQDIISRQASCGKSFPSFKQGQKYCPGQAGKKSSRRSPRLRTLCFRFFQLSNF